MKMRSVSILAVVLFVWAAFATFKWREASQNISSGTASPLFANEAVADLERAGFLRQFAEQYFNYDETSYWRNQTALAFLMAPDLRERKLTELTDQRDRKQAAGFRQSADLLEVLRRPDGSDELRGTLHGREGERVWKLSYVAQVILKEVRRSLENPWGLEIESLQIQTSPQIPSEKLLAVDLDLNRPATLVFPCFVENLESAAGIPLKIKITSLRTSEIQLVRTGALATTTTVFAHCHDKNFPIAINADAGPNHLFVNVSEAQGAPPVSRTLKAKAKPKEAYQKTLEEELGFVVEE